MAPMRNPLWSGAEYDCPFTSDVGELARWVFQRVCRSTFNAPGFCLIELPDSTDSGSMRRFMGDLKDELSSLHDTPLGFISAARFDQQETTRPHRDGGPEECFLMLGYEPTPIKAELTMFDFSKCAADLSITPTEFLAKHNPMFRAGEDLLRPYATPITHFLNERFQVLLINNSVAERPGWQGVLHTATLLNADPKVRRVVNSTMVSPLDHGGATPISPAAEEEFLRSDLVRRRGYDKIDLEDS